MRIRFLVLFFSVVLLANVLPLLSKAGDGILLKVEKFKLSNGLTVLLHVDRSAPLVAYYTWFKVGSRNEEPGSTGIAHLFEHMMFKGSKRYDGKTFDRLLGSSGASHNAFTTRDATAYYAVLPSNQLELIMDLESDRMQNLRITKENLDSEREVVKEERRFRVENQPQGALFETIFSTVFKVHPYRWPVIGWMEDLDKLTVEKCQSFYRTYYAPNNATIVIAGDFNVIEAKRLLEKYYSAIPAQPLPTFKFPEEPPQKNQREARISKNVQSEHFAVSFRTVDASSDENFAIEILSQILGGGESSRLYRQTVYEKQLATTVVSDHDSMAGGGIFTVYLSLKPGASHDEALQSVYSILWDARNRIFTDKELQIAKNQVLKQHIYALKTASGKASALGYNEVVFGSYERLIKDLEKYNAVTLEAVKNVASRYLNPEQRNLVVLNKFASPAEVKTTEAKGGPVE